MASASGTRARARVTQQIAEDPSERREEAAMEASSAGKTARGASAGSRAPRPQRRQGLQQAAVQGEGEARARVLQSRDRRAGRHRRDDHPGQGPGRRRRRRRGAALLGGAQPRGPRPLHAPRRRRAARGAGRDRRAAHQRAGQAAGRELHDGAPADRRLAQVDRRQRPGDPLRREALDAGHPEVEERQVHLRADRRGRRDRSLELPLVDPLRRGGDRADGRQRRRAEARQPDPADRRADPPDLREGRPARGPDPHRPRRRPDRRRAGQVDARGRSSSPARSRSATRSASSAPSG